MQTRISPPPPSTRMITEFLRESNAIERVYDEMSLVHADLAFDCIMEYEVMTVDAVLETHRILMMNQPIEKKYMGAFRDVSVYVGNREGMPPAALPFYVTEWCQEMNDAEPEGHFDNDSDVSKRLHVMYEKIHPFIDGNGRTGRMFMNWLRLKKLNLPLLIIHEGDEQDAYYKWFD